MRKVGSGGNIISAGGSENNPGGFGTNDYANSDHIHPMFDRWTDLTLNSPWTGTLKASKAGDLVMFYAYVFNTTGIAQAVICSDLTDINLLHFITKVEGFAVNIFDKEGILIRPGGVYGDCIRFRGNYSAIGSPSATITAQDPAGNITQAPDGIIAHAVYKYA